MNPELLMKMAFKMIGVNDQMRDQLLHQFIDVIKKVSTFDARLARIEAALNIPAEPGEMKEIEHHGTGG